MFLETLTKRNRELIAFADSSHKKGEIQPDSYILDIDTILYNAAIIKKEADQYGIELFFMLKQIGRNPYIAKRLVELGYKGAVAVDFREAQIMMEHGIPICHAGHLVQIPRMLLKEFLEYGIEYITVYSLEKAQEINEILKESGKKQKILLKFVDEACMIYPSQESGFQIGEIETITKELSGLSSVEIAGVTAFPAFLYQEESQSIEILHNCEVLETAARYLEEHFKRKIERNLPSCSQKSLMKTIHERKGTQAEPGNALAGTTPNNFDGSAEEIPAILYLTEISHNYEGKSYCYGGGLYSRGKAKKALVCKEDIQELVDVNMPCSENIDYYFSLEYEGRVSSTVIMCFRTQIFDTRSQVILVEGLREHAPKIIGRYDSQGKLLG
ncbi:alanine racemase [Anaerocolumna xylanovorans]|uniref:Predicted amino acid racemase n=1 Tax=Anaerocolumna xylanovorans DSM 12503 TaxID=1121345 RepID=A0A1M7XY49_9FIRM|nr:alanine racemase [Anaerocolumna xylanovorans]SHO43933.1 Predicted amino acid racemase [Anaerocolumna xylanovorans DSM 12503]